MTTIYWCYAQKCFEIIDKLLYPRLPDQATYKNTGTEIAVNLGSAYGHFDNLCLISADKIKTIGRPKTKRC